MAASKKLNPEILFTNWFRRKKWKAFDFQKQALEAYLTGHSGLLNAPTGTGKTYALWIPILIEAILSKKKTFKGLQAIWITPVRALAKDIHSAMVDAAEELEVKWDIALRTGDTSLKERKQQKAKTPNALITTPESLHLFLAAKEYTKFFADLKVIVIDEWHELLGTKRGVQVELALSRLKAINPELKIWGVSATIGNIEEALHVLLGEDIHETKFKLIRSYVEKKVETITVLPDEVERFPWAGHLGITLLNKILPIIWKGKSTLLFTNTRSQAEIWYQRLLEADLNLAGIIGLHHGSLDLELRNWVENALHEGILKIVVCTSSLDLGVDFRPVETVIQIGSPKGIARFIQRAGRSGHSPGETSKIYFVPTHALELLDAAALKMALAEGKVEKRVPLVRSFDVLIQYLVTLAVSDGFKEDELYNEVIKTFAFSSISKEEWAQVMNFITTGGPSLANYEEYSKVVNEDGIYKVVNKKIAMRHRLSIGTIVGDAVMAIKYLHGGFIGTIEEYFISRLNKGDVFSFAGKNLEYVMIKDMKVLVRKSDKKKAIVPQWMGGKMNLSSQLSELIRHKLSDALKGTAVDEEIIKLMPLFEKQKQVSIIPSDDQFLIESLETREGHHLFFFTFEGRYVNEGMAAVLAHRFSKYQPVSFSIAMNDYGFELLSDQKMDIEKAVSENIFSTENLLNDIHGGLNTTEMARRRFRNIANIAGLIFRGFPGKSMKYRHLQASSRLFFEVFMEHEPNHLLLKQAYEEALYDQLDEVRLRRAFQRISNQEIIIKYPQDPTPFSFPILVEQFREKMSNEKLEERVRKMIKQLGK